MFSGRPSVFASSDIFSRIPDTDLHRAHPGLAPGEIWQHLVHSTACDPPNHSQIGDLWIHQSPYNSVRGGRKELDIRDILTVRCNIYTDMVEYPKSS